MRALGLAAFAVGLVGGCFEHATAAVQVGQSNGVASHYPARLYDETDVSRYLPAPTASQVLTPQFEIAPGAADTALVFEPAERFGGDIGRTADAVGRLALKFRDRRSGEEGANWCTAWLISPDTVMTNYHCYPGNNVDLDVEAAKIEFRYLTADQAGQVATIRGLKCVSPELDFSLLQVDETDLDGAVLPLPLALSARDPLPFEPLYMIHHPSARPLQITRYGCMAGARTEQDYETAVFEHGCQTLGMSSGAPIFASSDNHLVGIHFSGPTLPNFDRNAPNRGRYMSMIVRSSPYLLSLLTKYEYDKYSNNDRPTVSIYFPYDRTDLNAQAVATVEFIVKLAETRGVSRILVIGHTDTLRTAAYNVSLSNRMARSVADALVARGISGGVISLDGKGESQLLTPSADQVRDPSNSIVEVFVWDRDNALIGSVAPEVAYETRGNVEHCARYGIDDLGKRVTEWGEYAPEYRNPDAR